MSEQKKANLFDDSDEGDDYKPPAEQTAPVEAPVPEAKPEEQVPETTASEPVTEQPYVPPTETIPPADPPKDEGKRGIFDDDEDEYVPPIPQQTDADAAVAQPGPEQNGMTDQEAIAAYSQQNQNEDQMNFVSSEASPADNSSPIV